MCQFTINHLNFRSVVLVSVISTLKDFPEIFSVTANVREVLVSGVTNIAEDDVTAVVLMVTDVAPAGMTPEPKEVELASVVPTLYFLAVTVPAILTLPY